MLLCEVCFSDFSTLVNGSGSYLNDIKIKNCKIILDFITALESKLLLKVFHLLNYIWDFL